jgi:O-succinylbenzoic acid--CoA ligase
MQVANVIQNETSKLNFEKVETVIIGGGEISKELENNLYTFSNVIYATYGMTETITHIALRKINGINASDKFIVLPPFSITVNENSCLVVEAKHLKNKIITNDLVKLDNKGFYWLGRIDNVVNSGGLKFSPEELENDIEHLLPFKFIISSIPDNVLGNKLVLVIESKTCTTTEANDYLDRVSDVLKGPKKLHDCRILGEFPLTKTGKIKRKEILVNLHQNSKT